MSVGLTRALFSRIKVIIIKVKVQWQPYLTQLLFVWLDEYPVLFWSRDRLFWYSKNQTMLSGFVLVPLLDKPSQPDERVQTLLGPVWMLISVMTVSPRGVGSSEQKGPRCSQKQPQPCCLCCGMFSVVASCYCTTQHCLKQPCFT